MKSAAIVAAVLVILLASAFAATGYAYTASTENSGNSVTSQYVTLTQQNYTFSSGSVGFDVIETGAGIRYQLVGSNQNQLIEIDGKMYYGVALGSPDKLTARMVGGGGGNLNITMSSPQLYGKFADFSQNHLDWRYILKVYASNEAHPESNCQYAYYDGASSGVWKYAEVVSGVQHSADNLVLNTAVDHYVTILYFAGPGEDAAASFREPGDVVKATTDITLTPVWAEAGADALKCTFDPNTDGGGSGTPYVYYFQSGVGFLLPYNNANTTNFTNTQGKVFAGWMDADNINKGKTFMPWHIISYTSAVTFKAVWANANDCWTVTFDSNGGTGSMTDQYVVKGNTYTLPINSFANTTHPRFTGWVVSATAGQSERDYSDYTAPITDVQRIEENITLTAQWDDVGSRKKVTLTWNNETYSVYTGEDGRYTLREVIFFPPAKPDEGFRGWESLGWYITKAPVIRTVAQSFTPPMGDDGYIIKNGTIKFTYENGLENEN